jgi:hypothetical protein
LAAKVGAFLAGVDTLAEGLVCGRSSRRCGYGFINVVLRFHIESDRGGEILQIYKRVECRLGKGIEYADILHR